MLCALPRIIFNEFQECHEKWALKKKKSISRILLFFSSIEVWLTKIVDIFKVYNMMFWYTCILWNGYCNQVTYVYHPHIVILCVCLEYLRPIQQISSVWYVIINCSYRAVTRTYSSYKWKFIPLYQYLPFFYPSLW